MTAAARWEHYHAAGREAYRQRQFDEAESHFLAARREAEALGAADPRLTTSLWDLVELYGRASRQPELERACRQLLAIQEPNLGPDHLDLVPILTALASVSNHLGQEVEAQALFRRALAIQEHHLGSDHPDLVRTLMARALHYWSQGRYAEPEPCFL